MSTGRTGDQSAVDAALELSASKGLFRAINAVRSSADVGEAVAAIEKSYGGIGADVALSLASMARQSIKAGQSYIDKHIGYSVDESKIPVSGSIGDGMYHVHVGVELMPGTLGVPVWKSFTLDLDHVPTVAEINDAVEEEVAKWIKDYFFSITPDIIDVVVESIVKGD